MKAIDNAKSYISDHATGLIGGTLVLGVIGMMLSKKNGYKKGFVDGVNVTKECYRRHAPDLTSLHAKIDADINEYLKYI